MDTCETVLRRYKVTFNPIVGCREFRLEKWAHYKAVNPRTGRKEPCLRFVGIDDQERVWRSPLEGFEEAAWRAGWQVPERLDYVDALPMNAFLRTVVLHAG